MREIKFRGISEDTGKWIYGGYHKPFSDVCQIIAVGKGNASQMLVVKEETVGEWSGAKDKFGNYIFEGDVNQDFGVVVWNKDSASFCWDYKDELMPFENEEDWCEISHTIHDERKP